MITASQLRCAAVAFSAALKRRGTDHEVPEAREIRAVANRLHGPLVQLKRHLIGRFKDADGWATSVFEGTERPDLLHAASIERDEVIHTRILGWLLDARKSGTLGPKLLIEIIARSYGLRKSVVAKLTKGGAKVIIESGGEGGRPDLEIRGMGFLVLIENKLDASQHSHQLSNYRKRAFRTARTLRVSTRNVILVYLTLSPDDESWRGTGFRHLSYKDLTRRLERLLKTASKADRSAASLAGQYLVTLQKLCMSQEGLSHVVRLVDLHPESVASLSLDSLKRLSEWITP